MSDASVDCLRTGLVEGGRVKGLGEAEEFRNQKPTQIRCADGVKTSHGTAEAQHK